MTHTLTRFPEAALEHVACSLCGARDGRHVFTISGFRMLQCPSCTLRYVSPRLKSDVLVEMYSEERYYKSENSLTHGYLDYVADRGNIIATFARRLDWVLRRTRRATPGKLLDVGCATGFALDYALERGWDAWGIEPSAYAASTARERLGNRVQHGTLDAHNLLTNSFDTVLLWDVIEHVPDPLRTLAQTRDLLTAGGYLSLITPDAGSFLAKVLGKRWMEYAKPTEHIILFSRRTIQKALEQTGFDIIAWGTAGKWVEMGFLWDRLSATIPLLRRLYKKPVASAGGLRLYINPGDKLHLIARRKA
jgi:SAM-dependent methyltransferase